ncbi:S49 family peptidase [Stappia sp. 28M-7]|uniref:S49 family peptidase n=1 Tax=Stappia sp. 28M-7 TaxID=2762596 RepID=UPI00163C73A3|nr:S49 family peptidase [Stappia sp. 28M-7]MBC2858269.1 S49 family peptidase [Stappia sp. 28M-7]
MFDSLRKRLPGKWGNVPTTIPVVRLQGAIGMASPLRPGLSLATVAPLLDKAFSFDAPAVALIVNSPGGSPVQSRLIHDRIRQLAGEKKKDVLVFVEDVAASGGYMLAIAGDEIVADENSIVGSIGVVSSGFGFSEAISKLGIERRVHTAGENKAILDPFRPEREEDIVHLKALQQEVHESFIALVRRRRGDVLTDAPDLFTGLFWTGATSRDLGLIDRIGDIRSTLRERFGDKVRVRLVGGPRSLFSRRQGVGVEIGAGLTQGWADEAIGALEQRALWARYGL